MADQSKVLIIDDDKTWQAFLTAALQDRFTVISALDGCDGLQKATVEKPDSILLDIEMPIMNGYDVCKQLKSDPSTKDIPILFLSCKSSIQEKIYGFEVGGDDYIIKPCESEILKARVSRSTALYSLQNQTAVQVKKAQALAFEAMNSSADLGRSIRFAERTYAMHSFDKLAEGLFQTMGEFGLDTAVMFVTHNGPLFYAQNQYELTPLEKDMFINIHQEGRFCDFGNRTFCNFKLISLLIKNMPLNDPERYGRIKDAVPWVLGAADGKVGALDLHNTLINQHEKSISNLTSLTQQLGHLKSSLTSTNDSITLSLNSMFSRVARLDKNSELDESEKEYQLMLNQLAKNNAIVDELSDCLTCISDLLTDQKRVQAQVEVDSIGDEMELGQDEIYSSDVDFF